MNPTLLSFSAIFFIMVACLTVVRLGKRFWEKIKNPDPATVKNIICGMAIYFCYFYVAVLSLTYSLGVLYYLNLIK